MIYNPIIDYYFVNNRQIIDYSNFDKIELINDFINTEDLLPNSFLLYFINELSENELIENVSEQRDKFYQYYRYADKNQFESDFLILLENEFNNLSNSNWLLPSDTIVVYSSIFIGRNIKYRFKEYENQYQFLIISNDWKYNEQYFIWVNNTIKSYFNQSINESNIPINNQNFNKLDIIKKDNFSPFGNEESKNLFHFIVENWSNNNTNKWGYIWEFFNVKGNGKITYKVDYENYLITHNYLTKGKVNYESCSSIKHYQKLEELLNQFKSRKI